MYVVFDIGGTKMRVAFSPDGTTLSDPRIVATPTSFSESVDQLVGLIRAVSDNQPVKAIVGGVAGMLNQERSKLLYAPNLESWVDQPLHSVLAKACGGRVYLMNDAALAALGEAHAGAGQGSTIMGYITVGTGVGGARVVNGRIDHYALGFEPGHQIIGIDTESKAVQPRTLSHYIAGAAIKKRFNAEPTTIADPGVWDELARYLAYGINNVIMLWSPDCIVLGGGLMKDDGIRLAQVQSHLSAIYPVNRPVAPLMLSHLGDSSGLMGALVWLEQLLVET